MHRTMMKSKIHRATVTGADLNYVGSITLDPRLMELADLLEHEQVHVLDIDNGARFETYVIRGHRGDVVLNGAAARLVHTGDRIIVISYAEYDEEELESYAPKIVQVDSRNRPMDQEFQELDRGDGGFADRRSRSRSLRRRPTSGELHELAP
jgi:aspartate 1-decarboxylase